MNSNAIRVRFGRLVWTVLVVAYFIVFFTNLLADAMPVGRLLPSVLAVMLVLWMGVEYYFAAPFFQSGLVDYSNPLRVMFAVFVYPFIAFCAGDHIWWHITQLPLPAFIGGGLGIAVFAAGAVLRLTTLFSVLRITATKPSDRRGNITIPERKYVALPVARVCRHPRDFGTLLQLLGIALTFNSWGGLVLVLSLGLPLVVLQARHDEKGLRVLLRDEADRYFATTPFLLPRLRPR